MVLGARLRVHRDRLEDRVGDLLRVPGVDDNTTVQALGRTSEFGQDHDALSLLLAGDVLVRHLFDTEQSDLCGYPQAM